MLKAIYQKVLPAWLRRRLHPLLHPRIAVIETHARRHARGRVSFGPFAGMRLVEGDDPIHLLLATYECELHDAYARLQHRTFSQVLDIGAAEGYYVVGPALWQKHASVTCWESEEAYHPRIRALARANGVEDRIDVRGFCDFAQLEEFSMRDTLIVMDIEGYEATLLDPERLPQLRRATILVEYHPNEASNCGALIEDRFRQSHQITKYEPHHRTPADYPLKSIADNALLRTAATLAIVDRPTWQEGLHGWLLLEPKAP